MPLTYPTDVKPGTYSELCVMKSAAGYYVGTYFMDDEFNPPFLCPGSRDSQYFATEEEASSFLTYLTGEAHVEDHSDAAQPR